MRRVEDIAHYLSIAERVVSDRPSYGAIRVGQCHEEISPRVGVEAGINESLDLLRIIDLMGFPGGHDGFDVEVKGALGVETGPDGLSVIRIGPSSKALFTSVVHEWDSS